MAERIIGILLILGVLFWMGANLVKAPSDFFQNIVTGLNRGVLFALIALGYTLVYGIIELINFAHGDLFMLSTLFAGTLITSVFGVHTSGASVVGWLIFLVALVGCMAFGGGINVAIELVAYRRLRHAPKLAPLIT